MGYTIAKAESRLVRVPVDPPRGDAIQEFDALELPIVTITDSSSRTGIGFGYTIGAGGSTILELLRAELLEWLIGQDARRITFIHEYLNKSIHALTPGCIASTALAAIDVALWDLAGKRAETPLHILLGGAKDRVLIYNTHVGWLNRPLEEMVKLCRQAHAEFPHVVFFASKLVFENETWITRLLHNQIVYAIQRRLQLEGMPMVILPMQAPSAVDSVVSKNERLSR